MSPIIAKLKCAIGGSRQTRHQVISHDNLSLCTAPAFAHVTAKTDLAQSARQLGASAQRPRWPRWSKIQPLLRDQSLAVQFEALRENVRAIPLAVLAWLAAHGFQPDLVCKSHWTAVKVSVGLWCLGPRNVCTRPDMIGFPVRCFPPGLSEERMAVRADRLADGHKSFIPKGLDCVP